MDDAHALLAAARPGLEVDAWTAACAPLLTAYRDPRRQELLRIVRDHFLDVVDGVVVDGLFLGAYARAPAAGQISLVDAWWALAHPLPLRIAERLAAPALAAGRAEVSMEALDRLVAEALDTHSEESLRKTRTTAVGALERVGTLLGIGSGRHRRIEAARGTLHPAVFALLVVRELRERGADGMMEIEAVEGSLPVRLMCCTPDAARHALEVAGGRGWLMVGDDEVRAPPWAAT